ncbi:MAG: hypothetical protein JSU86_05245 [Phycisphaerales bacterium]|nr:MAG: hypothetical protein JSU86_05245 [Phycisphaerales bacterium]
MVVGAGTPEGRHYPDEAFRWENGVVTGIGDLAGGTLAYCSSEAYDVSADGSVIVGNSIHEPGTEAFRWEDGILVGLDEFPGGLFFSYAYGVSADGSVVVGSGGTDLGVETFVWDAQHGMRNLPSVLETEFNLDLIGWQLKAATGVSANGATIVGWGDNPAGDTEGWIVRIVFDSDGDGIRDPDDRCPSENAMGLDANADGCVDRIADLPRLIQEETDVPNILEHPILAIVHAAVRAFENGNPRAAERTLTALVRLVRAHRAKTLAYGRR